MEHTEVIATTLEKLVSIASDPASGHLVEGIEFRGLTFAEADWTMPPTGYADVQSASYAPAAIVVVGARNLVIDHCTLEHSGGYGVWFARGSQHNRITATEIFDMGAGGVKIGEAELRSNTTEQSGNTLVEDNHIHDLGKVFVPAVGVWVLESAGNKILHNHIHHLFYTAISLGWTWGYGPSAAHDNLVAFNDLHDIGQGLLSDMGAIYTLGKQPGTILRNNLIHDVTSSVYGGWGIYTDEGSSSILIEDNIVYRCKSGAFLQHYGEDNLVQNNIFALDAEHEMVRASKKDLNSFRIEHNIIYASHNSIFSGDWAGDQFEIGSNLYFVSGGVAPDFPDGPFATWQAAGHDQNSVIADPLFVDAEHFNFALRPSSPALKTGFRAIDMSKVGPLEVPGAAAW
jgi:parallel beta-helix repeat protein